MAIGFRHHLQQQLHRLAVNAGRPFVSWTEPWEGVDPVSFFMQGPSCGFRERFFWADRTGGTILVGLGSVYAIETEKADSRFDDVEAGRRRWEKEMEPYGAADAPPLLFGGFSFDPYRPGTDMWRGFPAGKLVAPAALLAVRNGKTTLTVTVPTDKRGRDWERVGRLLERISDPMAAPKRLPRLVSDEEEEKERWLAAVREAIASIRAGALDKVVLARARRLAFAKTVDAAAVLQRLREQQPFAYIFAFEQDGRCFIGASPEQLVQKEGKMCRSVCLAGSVRRGAAMEEDERLGAWLRADRKNNEEHQFVVQMIGRLFSSVCETVEMPPAPQLLKLPHIQHLCTPVVGRGCRERSVLRLVEMMHPTPALGGTPRDRALEVIRALEPLDRGWYAAPIGWVDGEGNGEWAVAIRSALLVGKEAVLFAGCGIVADSDPNSEYEETNVKMAPMLSALGVMNDG
ncbi:isochorismate synthase MenF [Geobacillus sp. C56-T3]|uniref:isochorismate synthase n=1 Tax=Geobacillus sp. (strain C56-T3) TaxID=691437 RepID=UPI0001D5824D|nr:isochorismate synthase [Geobacillus sp. C56-T3]ADI25660.1 isochorismate synthase [Geobacillus sp. C56-T3]